MFVIWSMFACNPSEWKSQYLLAFSSTWLCWKCFLLWFFCCICLYLLYSPTAQGSVASAAPPTAPPIAPPPAAAAGERSRVIVFARGGNHHHHHSPVSRETSFPLETLCRIRPDICHEYHELYSWRKNCHVETFQISPHDRCGEIWNSPHMAFVWCGKRRHICKIYTFFF